jgi:hypothetical protein
MEKIMTTDQLERQNQEANGKTEDPRPDPAMKRLLALVGTWRLEGHVVGSEDYNIKGTTRFQWLHQDEGTGTGFYLQQDMDMDYAGKRILAHELIGYDPETRAFSSLVYQNLAAEPWRYEWDMQGREWTISIKRGEIDSIFKGRLSPDGNSFTGGWRPSPGADENANASYDVKGTRI